MTDSLRLAVAQTVVVPDVPTAAVVAAARDRVLEQQAEAAALGAHLVCFPEGTLTYPGKRHLSRIAPELGEADWTRVDWPAISHALEAIAERSAALGIWTVVGAPHRLTAPTSRPHNSLYVFDDRGALVTRYDKRYLSTNEAAYLYTPGEEDVIVDVDGVRIGFLVCLEALFPERFAAYADAGSDVVLLSSAPDPNFAMLAHSAALVTGLHVGVAFGAGDGRDDSGGRSGICSMFGWSAQAGTTAPTVVVADVVPHRGLHDFQRRARSGELYEGLAAPAHDPRSRSRTTL